MATARLVGHLDGYDVQEILRALELTAVTVSASLPGAETSAGKLAARWGELMEAAGIGRYEAGDAHLLVVLDTTPKKRT